MIYSEVYGLAEAGRFFEMHPRIAQRAARMATNDTAQRRGLKLGRDLMLSQVAWPPGYLNQDRFFVSKRATDTDLEAAIRGRFTPTSLARFTGRRVVPRRGTALRVTINPGRSVAVPRAFLINLRNGNLGLAIRLRPGETLQRSTGARMITTGPLRGVALLYGPSIDQVFRTVAPEMSPQLLEYLEDEFLRQYFRLIASGGL